MHIERVDEATVDEDFPARPEQGGDDDGPANEPLPSESALEDDSMVPL